jgi:hydrogenase assembly chaperone HypC/HupF
MCVSFPGRVIAVDESGASVLQEGLVRRASTLLEPDVQVGDWVMVAVGTIVERLDEERAAEMREALYEALRLMAGSGGSSPGEGEPAHATSPEGVPHVAAP